MKTPQYSHLAKIYSHLMRAIDYKHWADYVLAIYKITGIKTDTVLELAGGNCIVSKFLKNKFKKIIVSDSSIHMLRICGDNDIIKVCCDMGLLPFSRKYSFIFSTFDSVNYILDNSDLQRFFKNISFILNNDGRFTFDISLEKNSIKHQKHLTRKGIYEGIKYSQKSYYDKHKKIHYNYFKIQYKNGCVFEETHMQRVYDFEESFDIIDKSGLYVEYCFDGFTFKDAHPGSERVQFVVKKSRL